MNGFGGLETRLALLWLALPLLVGALAVTRSFATVLSLAAAGAVLAIATPRRRSPRRALAVLGVVLVACLALLVGRDASRALGGRAYLVRVAAPHLLDRPLTGLGPGAVEASWPGWETAAWSAGSFTAAEVPFAAAQDHLHQDFLERAVEQGALGLGALLVVVAVALRRLVRAADPRSVAAAAGIAALLARGLVDFPLARPAEAALFALLLAAGLSSSPPQEEHP